MKKLFNILLAVVLTIACAFSLTACSTDDSGSTGRTGLVISKDKQGNYVIRDFVYVDGCLDEEGTLVIDDFLTAKGIGYDDTVKISTGAFDGDDKIYKLIVSDKIDEIEQGAFRNMKSLEFLQIPFVGKNAKADAVYNQTDWAEGKATDKERTFSHFFGETAYEEGRKMNNGFGDVYVPYSLRKVKVDATEKVDYTVYDGTNLLKEGYAIARHAFKGANFLQEITLSGVNLKEIGEEAFSGCSALKKLIIPDTIKTIYASAFSGCLQLTDVIFEGINVVLKENVFSGCTSMNKIYRQQDNTIKTTVDLSCFLAVGNNAFDFGREVKYTVINQGTFNLKTIFGDTETN